MNIRILAKEEFGLDCFLSGEPDYIYKQIADLR